MIRLRECWIERRQQVAAVDPIAGPDMDLADNRGFQRLHHEIGAHGNQLSLGRYDHVDLRHRGPGNRRDNQRKDAIEREACETRWRPLLYLDRVGLEFGDQARLPGGGPEKPSPAPFSLSRRRQLIRFSRRLRGFSVFMRFALSAGSRDVGRWCTSKASDRDDPRQRSDRGRSPGSRWRPRASTADGKR